MYSFGKNPPRLFESFGVSGLLNPDCKVFYETLFSTRHVGKVSDLLSSGLRDLSADELRLRALLLFTAFEAFQFAPSNGNGVLSEPVVLECGVDDEKIAIGVLVTFPGDGAIEPHGLPERIKDGNPRDRFEELLIQVAQHCNRLVVRTLAGQNQVEVVGVFGIPGRMDDALLSKPCEVSVHAFKEKPADAPKPESYVQLADLDYKALLRPDHGTAADQGSSAGVLPDEDGLEESTALADALRSRTQSAGDDKVVISGVTQSIKDDRIVVKGSAGSDQDDTRMVVKGGADEAASSAAGWISPSQAKLYIDRIEELQKKISVLEEDRATATILVKSKRSEAADEEEAEPDSAAEESADEIEESGDDEESEISDEQTSPKKSLKSLFSKDVLNKKFLKKLWKFNKDEDDEDEEGESETSAPAEPSAVKKADEAPRKKEEATEKAVAEEASEEETATSQDGLADAAVPGKTDEVTEEEAVPPAAKTDADSEAENAAKSLMVEIAGGSLDRTIMRAQQEAAEIKKELGSAKAKKWVDGLMAELVAEKARLHELSKKLNTSVRQKEIEFKGREQSLNQELKRRDEMVRQKNVALGRAKDQIAQLNMNIERAKTAGKSAGGDPHMKQKYAQAQKLLVVTKGENTTLKKKLDELRNQLTQAQFAVAKKDQGPSQVEHKQVQKSLERAQRQVEEFKRTNQQLMDRLNKEKGGAGSAPSAAAADDTRQRLDAAMKMVTATKKEAEQLRLRVDELEREEQRLKRELEQTFAQLKALKGKAA